MNEKQTIHEKLAEARETAEHALTVLFCERKLNLQESCPPWLTTEQWSRKLELGTGD